MVAEEDRALFHAAISYDGEGATSILRGHR